MGEVVFPQRMAFSFIFCYWRGRKNLVARKIASNLFALARRVFVCRFVLRVDAVLCVGILHPLSETLVCHLDPLVEMCWPPRLASLAFFVGEFAAAMPLHSAALNRPSPVTVNRCQTRRAVCIALSYS